MQCTFPTAAFMVGEGVSRRKGTARDVALTVENLSTQDKPETASPFLGGPIRAEGFFLEACAPNKSMLAVGREAVLKLVHKEKWSAVGVLIVKLGEIRTPEPGQRLYPWSFLVTGKPRDPMRLFLDRGPGEVALEDLLALQGDSHVSDE
jgi:hypothetical protein